jgi:hypothetical protein
MASLGRALMAGLVAGGAKFADMKMDEKQKAADAERQQKLLDLQKQLMQESERFKASLKSPQYQTIEDTGPDGKTVKRTIRSSYDPESQGFVEKDVGSAVVPPKQERAESEAEFFARDPKGFAAYKASGRAPSGSGSGSGEEGFGFEDYESMDPERRSLYDRWKGRASVKDQEAADRKWLAQEEQKAVGDFDSTASDYTARNNLLGAFGIDPKDPKAREKYAKAYRTDLESRFNPGEKPEPAPIMESARGPGQAYPKFGSDSFAPKTDIFASETETVEPERAAPKKAGAKKESPYPEGTKLKGPDGKIYIVKDGQPVPYGG